MTEDRIREVAERYGLAVHKRITTGSATEHFATFELSGAPEQIDAAWEVLKPAMRHRDFDYTRHSDADGSRYIGLESVWCEVEGNAEAPTTALEEQQNVQLAGVSVAALGGTKEPCLKGQWGWSPAYQDTLELRIRYDAAIDALRLHAELLDNSDVRDFIGRKLGEQSRLHAALKAGRAVIAKAEGR